MKAAVFGGIGFIGRAVVNGLIEKGYQVRVGTRSVMNHFPGHQCEVKEIDYASADSIKHFVEGQDFAVNCIANVHGQDMSEDAFRRVEVHLTETIAKTCADLRIPLIQLSSIIAFGRKLPETAVDETFAGSDFEMMDRICLEREQAVKKSFVDSGDYVILRPVPVFGAKDKGSAIKRILDLYPEGAFPIVDGGLAQGTFIDQRDFGVAVAMAIESFDRIKGDTFIVGGFIADWMQIKQALDTHFGLDQPYAELSKSETESKLGYRTAEFMSNPRLYKDEKFRAATGYSSRYLLKDAIDNYFGKVEN